MSSYTQAGRPMAVTTPLGPDVLLLTGLKGHEGVSELFHFELQLLAESRRTVAFEKVLGQGATVELELPGGGKRYIDGIVSRFTQGRRDETFTHFRAELVPKLWFLTRKVQSRIFQRLTVPEILAKVLTGILVRIEVSGVYEPRDYCTQYRESDFAFASRLMEEEGIRYYFRHSAGSHQLVLTDDPEDYPDLPGQSEIVYEEIHPGGKRTEMRVVGWEKSQEVRSDLCTLWDHCFELPGQNLEAQQPMLDSVPAGEVTHKLRPVGRDPLEAYDFPGGYAQRFDSIDPSGAERPAELQKIYLDRERTVRLRMETEEMLSLRVDGRSYCQHFCPGHAFTLSRHFDANGRYLITRVSHEASLDGDYRTGGVLPFHYENEFRCIPAALPYRPPRSTPRPVIAGSQTATIVAPPGEDLFCDKYGRVKVLFHWDREGKKDGTSSCWIRVAQPWAGKGWGAFFWPRAGHEVVVSFEEGDPDQPVIVGSVYNSENMPPFPLPLRNRVGGIKSASVRGIANQHYNGIVFYDEKGNEHTAIHSERNLSFNTELDKMMESGRNRHEGVAALAFQTVGFIPGGGGSGGGSFEPFGSLGNPTGVGLNCSMTYGGGLTGVVGLQTQATVGSNMQIAINPTFLLRYGGKFPFWMEGLLGGGLGGNLSLTMGTNTSVTMGPNVSIKSTADVEYDMSAHVATKVILTIIAAVYVLWAILYATVTSTRSRGIEWAVFQTALAAGLTVMVTVEAFYKAAKDAGTDTIWAKYKKDVVGTLTGAAADTAFKQANVKNTALGIVGTVLALITPILVAGGVGKQAD